jgi:tetratricopeptide (TPR) repeat protein
MFYNARVSYDEASVAHRKLLKQNPDSVIVSMPSDIQSKYDRAIEKASKVLDEYPKNKKWHDDALFLIGKANYFKGEYEKALRSLHLLREDFPASPFIAESYLFSGKAYLKLENFDKAEEMFNLVLEKYPQLNADQEVTLLKVEIALSREGKAMAVDLLEKTNARITSKEKRIELTLKTARLYMDLKQFDKAIDILRGCPRERKYPEKLFIIDFMLAGCFEAKDSLNRAMDMLAVMQGNRAYSWHTPEILLKRASIFDKMGRTDEAISTYVSVAELYAPAAGTPGSAGSQEAAEMAWYRLGLIYQLKKGDFAKAKEYFNKISGNAKDTAIRSSAARRIKSIDTLLAYIGLKDTVDTVKNRGRRDEVAFKIGELYWLELDLPDSAYVNFKRLAMKSDSLRPKSLYSAAYIARTALKDTAGSDSIFAILLKNYPANEYTKMAQKDRGEKITVQTRRDSAQDAYLKAESLYFNSGAYEDAINAFKAVYAAYPDCEDGIKALYAAGWISNEILQNNKIAYKLYKTLCDSFPKSDICLNQVKPRLKTVSDTLAARKTRGKSPQAQAVSPQAPKAQAGPKPTPVSPEYAAKNSPVAKAKDTASLSKSPIPPPVSAPAAPHSPVPSSLSKPDAPPAPSVMPAVPKPAPAKPQPETGEPETLDSVEVIGTTH